MKTRILWWVSGLLLLGILFLNVSWAVRGTYSRDENLTLAGGSLLAQGFLPYRDFLYIHQPYPLLIYAALFHLTDNPLLAARLFSALCSAATAWLVFALTVDALQEQDPLLRFGMGWASALFLAANPLYAYSAGFAWNHPPSTLCMLFTTALLIWGLRHTSWRKWLFLSGVIMGLAIGTRVSAIALVIPCVFFLLLQPMERWKRLWIWGGGLFLALVPSGLSFLLAPSSYLFGNLTYHQLSSVYWQELKPDASYSLLQRLAYLGSDVIAQPGNLLWLFLLLFVGGLAVTNASKQDQWSDASFWWLLLPFVIISSLLASPARYQYFSPIVPFAIVTVVFTLAMFLSTALANIKKPLVWAFLLCVFLALSYQAMEFKRITFLLAPDTWRPLAFHGLGQKIDELAPPGKILTLVPQFAIEAGRPIYPQFSTGSFAWRVTPQLDPAQINQLGLVAQDELDTFLISDPPAAILVGLEGDLDVPLVTYARSHGYNEQLINQDLQLWVRESQDY